MPIRSLSVYCLLFCACQLLPSCTVDDTVNYVKGEGLLKLDLGARRGNTTARVFVTVADLRLDGKSVPGFRRASLELTELSHTSVINLFSGLVDSRDYESIELLLDPHTDQFGDGPGCYTIDEAGDKRALLVPGSGLVLIPARQLSLNRSGFASGTIEFDLQQALIAPRSARSNYELVLNRWNHQAVTFAAGESTPAQSTQLLELKK